MKLLVLYRPESEHSRAVETFVRDFRYQHEHVADKVEVLNVDSREGVALASLYDIMEYPAILALGNDGMLLKFWSGATLPLMSEVAGYFYNEV